MRSLLKNFDLSFVNELKDLYGKLSAESKLDEPAAKFRDSKVRFNPRPARILHILINEANYRDKAGILRAIEMCFKQNSLILDNLTQINQTEVDLVSISSFLDELRHLHMNKDFDQHTVAFAIEQIESLRAGKYLEPNPRLSVLIEFYEKRLRRKLKPV